MALDFRCSQGTLVLHVSIWVSIYIYIHIFSGNLDPYMVGLSAP